MKRIIILLIIILSFTGCTISKLETNNIEELTDLILLTNHKLINQTSKGYKYYLPKGVILIDNLNYNDTLAARNNLYYLYVDIASFYFKKQINYQPNKESYFSKELNYRNKGYLEINKINDWYFIEMMYNYAIIETLVRKKDIENAIIDLSYILSSVTFNQKVIKLMFDKDSLSFNEQRVDIFENKGKKSNFLDYANQYDVCVEPCIEEEGTNINLDQNIME